MESEEEEAEEEEEEEAILAECSSWIEISIAGPPCAKKNEKRTQHDFHVRRSYMKQNFPDEKFSFLSVEKQVEKCRCSVRALLT